MNMMIIASIAILVIVLIVAYKGLKHKQPSDSALRQRAVFNTVEQLTFTRLKDIFPEANILAHVSFDALLTTKFPRTRRKYQKLFADFVLLDKDFHVMAIIALGDGMTTRRANSSIDQDVLLDAAGYRVIRYQHVPEYQQLREDFLIEYEDMQTMPESEQEGEKLNLYSARYINKTRVFG
ncbi:hypothetical protein AMD27_00810 [Acinetobacter sp. TGL-Y2]|uniref:DUF2726 domain-containing protein n=1 Tax=Acinetobacter sp. TGL-Y2 TaxID=1407071 RepID=UPI0007A67D80|nr:hypothetical protein AMD27_00810 [Acinetobacter sp. TGL-Y2]